MPWVVGIDEAGYGPNLGPLVQAAVALRLPDDDVAGWTTVKPWVRRAHEKDDGRLLIDDSKKVYAGAKGFERLERVVLACKVCQTESVGQFIGSLSDHTPDHGAIALMQEAWFVGSQPLPLESTRVEIDRCLSLFFELLTHLQINAWGFNPTVLPASTFNFIVDSSGTKATATAHGLIRLMQQLLPIGRVGVSCWPDDAVHFICDKQGGRNFYGALLQEAFPDGWVVAERESAAESRYRILNLNREVGVVFRPKADGDSVCVALASMICKYLREVCMRQFNTFWQKHVPGLQPTAGYPVDAKRFYAEIRPAMEKLGIPPDAVWRKK